MENLMQNLFGLSYFYKYSHIKWFSFGRYWIDNLFECFDLINYETFAQTFSSSSNACDDQSDKFFQVNSSCTTEKYQKIFKNIICPNTTSSADKRICANISKWINEKTSSRYLDPHDCQSSCKTPSYGCEACTNEKYSFQCLRDGIMVCIHPELR